MSEEVEAIETEEIDAQAAFAAKMNNPAEEDATPPTSQEEEGEATQDPPAAENAPEESANPETVEPTLAERLSQLSGGKITDEDSLKSLLEEHEQLKAPKEPIWKNDKQKLIYEYATKFDGNEVQAMKQYLEVQSLDVEKLDARETLFQQYRLSPDNADLTSEEARKLFDLEYEAKYERMKDEEDPQSALIKRQHDKEVLKAKQSIAQMQAEYAKASEPPVVEEQPKVDPEVAASVERVVKNFKGVELKLEGADPYLIGIDKSEIEGLKSTALDPAKMFNEAVPKMVDEKGEFSMQTYVSRLALATRVLHEGPESIVKGFYNHAKLAVEKGLKNIEKPENTAANTQTLTKEQKIAASIEKAKKEQGWK